MLRTQGARRASHFTVARDALLTRLASLDGEVIGDVSTAAEVHLVGCLAFERSVGDPLVVVLARNAFRESRGPRVTVVEPTDAWK